MTISIPKDQTAELMDRVNQQTKMLMDHELRIQVLGRALQAAEAVINAQADVIERHDQTLKQINKRQKRHKGPLLELAGEAGIRPSGLVIPPTA